MKKVCSPLALLLSACVLLATACMRHQLSYLQPEIPNGGRAVAISVHPSNDSKIVVASETGGLFLTQNGGGKWTQVSGSGTFFFADVQHWQPNPDIVIAVAQADTRTVSAGGIWRSTNGGSYWERVPVTPPSGFLSPPPPGCSNGFGAFCLDLEPGTNKLWAGTSCGLAFSTDGGATWDFQPTGTFLSSPEKVSAVVAPAAGHLKILTSQGLKVTENGGTTWSVSKPNTPGGSPIIGIHNQIAVSPFNHRHIFWTFNYWEWVERDKKSYPHTQLHLSSDNGASWSLVMEVPFIGRPPFVRVANALANTPDRFDLYFSDGGCTFQRTSVTNGSPPVVSGAWSKLVLDHCDPSDLAFRGDKKTPLLLATDGGLHITSDRGASWRMDGAGKRGYNALQMTEVTGQLHDDRKRSDLYFATQDNHIWASPDNGANWVANICCEGFFLNISREPTAPQWTKITGVSCAGCSNFTAGHLLTGATAFPNPPKNAGNPCLIEPGAYIQHSQHPGIPGNVFCLTENSGTTWTARYGFPEQVSDLSKISNTHVGNPVIFTAVESPGSSGNIGIKRIVGVYGTGDPVVSNVSGFGSLGIFATMFAWYKPFGVHPFNPNHLIVPDIIDQVVKVTRDGGATWTVDASLTKLVTNGGEFKFNWGQFGQISTIAFDPEHPCNILVGTVQAGIFRSEDEGLTWEKVPYSEQLPLVSSFYFMGNDEVAVSTYGRGLWKLDYGGGKKCYLVELPPFEIPLPHPGYDDYIVYHKGVLFPLRDMVKPEACSACTFLLAEGGWLTDFNVAPGTDEVKNVSLNTGELRAYDLEGKQADLLVQVHRSAGPGDFGGDKGLVALLKNKEVKVKGLLLEGNIFKGAILAQEDISLEQLPKTVPPAPQVRMAAGKGSGILPMVDDGMLELEGFGFDPSAPIEFFLDGEKMDLQVEPRFDSNGNFTIRIPIAAALGAHVLLVRQETMGTLLEDALTIMVKVRDEPKEGH